MAQATILCWRRVLSLNNVHDGMAKIPPSCRYKKQNCSHPSPSIVICSRLVRLYNLYFPTTKVCDNVVESIQETICNLDLTRHGGRDMLLFTAICCSLWPVGWDIESYLYRTWLCIRVDKQTFGRNTGSTIATMLQQIRHVREICAIRAKVLLLLQLENKVIYQPPTQEG